MLYPVTRGVFTHPSLTCQEAPDSHPEFGGFCMSAPPRRGTHNEPAKSGHAPDRRGYADMILIARVGQIEMFLDDEQPGTIGYNPEYLEDVARRAGRVAVQMYADIPSRHMIATDEDGE